MQNFHSKNTLLFLIKESGIYFFGQIFQQVVGLVFSLIVANYLGAKIYGQFVLAFSAVSLVSLFLKFGFDNGLVYFIPKLIKTKNRIIAYNQIWLAIFISLSTAVLFGTIILIFSSFIASNFLNNTTANFYLKILSYYIVFSTVVDLMFGVYRGFQNLKAYVFSANVIRPIVKLLVLIFSIYFGFKQLALPLALYISTFVSLFMLLIFAKNLDIYKNIKISFNKNILDLVKYSLPLYLSGFITFLLAKMDIFMIGYFLTSQDVGVYSIIIIIGGLSNLFLTSINTVFAPIISALYHSKNILEISKLFKVLTRWILFFTLIFFVIVLVFSEQILAVFGKEFQVGATALIIIVFGNIVNAATGSSGVINTMTGKPQYSLYTNFIIIILKFGLNYFLILDWGIIGAAIASAFSVGLANLIRLYLVFRDHNIHPYDISYLKMFILILPISLCLYYVIINIEVYWKFQFIVFSTMYVLAVILAYFLLGITEEDKVIIDTLKRKIKI